MLTNTIVNVIGVVLFWVIIVLKKLYYSLAFWDGISFLIVVGGSSLVWFIYYMRHREWDFFARNIAVFLGLFYAILWGIELVCQGHKDVLLATVSIPLGYGFICSLIANLVYHRME